MKAHPALERYLSGLEAGCLIYMTVVVEGEVRFGIERLAEGRKRRTLSSALDKILDDLDGVLAVSRDTARAYSTLKADLWKRGRPMSENDLWIAATAIEHRLVLVTNDGFFRQVPQLAVEDWLGG